MPWSSSIPLFHSLSPQMSMSVPLAMEAVTSDVKTQRAPSTAIARLGMVWDQDCDRVLVSSLLVSSKDVKLTSTFPSPLTHPHAQSLWRGLEQHVWWHLLPCLPQSLSTSSKLQVAGPETAWDLLPHNIDQHGHQIHTQVHRRLSQTIRRPFQEQQATLWILLTDPVPYQIWCRVLASVPYQRCGRRGHGYWLPLALWSSTRVQRIWERTKLCFHQRCPGELSQQELVGITP